MDVHKKNNSQKNKIVLILFFFTLGVGVLSSCKKDCFKSAGEIDTLEIQLTPFDRINIYDIFEVKLKQDTFYSTKIITNTTLIKNISIDNNSGLLTIKDKNKCYFGRKHNLKIILEITVKELGEINLYNASTLNTDDTLHFNRFMFRSYSRLTFAEFKVNCQDHLFISLWNVTGNIKVAGTATYLQILNHGASNIDALNLCSLYTQIEHRSPGDTKVQASEALVIKLFNTGNIYYKGSPVITSQIFGSGKIININ